MTGIDPGTAAALLLLGVCVGVELTRIAIDWNHDPQPGGTMRHLTALITTIALVGGLVAAAAAHPTTCDPDTERVFADVPADYPFCAEIEELWRRGATTGCQVEEDGTRFYCPSQQPNRGQLAAFVVGSTPPPGILYVRVQAPGSAPFSEGVAAVDKLSGLGVYRVTFDRPVIDCTLLTSPRSVDPAAAVFAAVIPPDEHNVYVYTEATGGPTDMTFDLVLHCAEEVGFTQ